MRAMPLAVVALLGALALSACGKPQAPADAAAAQPAVATPVTAPGGFVDRVWRVRESSAVAPGTLYTFLSEGTLVVAAASGTPSLGRWRYENGALTMTEEGQDYPTDIVGLGAREFRIRSHNPGTPVDIVLEPAAR
jgi:hypothetical protein